MPRKRKLDESAILPKERPPTLFNALRELDAWRYRFKDIPELSAVLQELDRLDRHVRILDALNYAKQLEGEGYPRPEAAARAASVFHQPREALLELLRAR